VLKIAKSKKYPNLFQVYLSEELDIALREMAKTKDIPKTVLVREILEEHIKSKDAINAKSIIHKEVSEAVDEKLKPVEERLAKIVAKTSYMQGILMYMQIITLADAGKRDVIDTFHTARKKSLQFVKETPAPSLSQWEDFARETKNSSDTKKNN